METLADLLDYSPDSTIFNPLPLGHSPVLLDVDANVRLLVFTNIRTNEYSHERPERVRLLIDDAYAGSREAGRKAVTQVEQRTHTVSVLNDAVELQRFEQEGFGGILQQKDKSLLDGRLNQLQSTRKQVAARQLEKERSRGRERDDPG